MRGSIADVTLEEVADGVYAFVQPDGSWCLNNAGLITAGGQVTLVDTAATAARAHRLRELAGTVSPAPPSVVVNTHSHGDHTFGNFAFPEALVVAHEGTRTDAAGAGLHLTTLWPEVEWGEIELVLPGLTYRDRMTVHTGGMIAELRHFGPAHTCDDTVVWLPEQRVLFAGDLVMSGVTPFVMSGSVSGLRAAIARLRELDPVTIVPGHGRPGGVELLDATERYLAWLAGLASGGLAAGLDPLEVAREADLGPFGRLLDPERLVPNLIRAYAEERGEPPGAPQDIGASFSAMVEFHGGLPTCLA